MLVQEYLSIRQAIDFVFELTGEKIDGLTLEELSNIEQLTPVFLFSGYVGYPDDKTIRYDKMKAYFTHDDFFMHQTRNHEDYSMFSDADVPEWIEIHSPFTIQSIIKQQSQAYSVSDEVFLFKNPPIGELDKLDDLKYSRIDFDEVRFSKNELLGLFSNVNKIGESQKKADDKSKLVSKENDNLSLEQSPQVTKLQKRIDELEKELSVFKEGSNDLREVIKVNFTDDEYRDIVELANQDGVSESEYVSNAVMKAIDTIYPFITAFDLNDDENLSKARSKFLNYLKENKNSFEVFSMLADAEIFPREHSHSADDNIEQNYLYNWQAMDKNQYPPELHLAIEIWKEYYHPDAIKHISQFDAGRFNRIANDFNLSQGNLKSRIRSLLTPLNSKTKSPELLSSLEVINIIHNDKLEQD